MRRGRVVMLLAGALTVGACGFPYDPPARKPTGVASSPLAAAVGFDRSERSGEFPSRFDCLSGSSFRSYGSETPGRASGTVVRRGDDWLVTVRYTDDPGPYRFVVSRRDGGYCVSDVPSDD